jgi:hypothetical protein
VTVALPATVTFTATDTVSASITGSSGPVEVQGP